MAERNAPKAPWNVPGESLVDRLATWLAGMDAPTEADTDYDGLLSYASEAHAAIIGLACGFGLGVPGVVAVTASALGLKRWESISNRKALRELRREPWYGIGASILGHLAQHYGILGWILDLVQSLPF